MDEKGWSEFWAGLFAFVSSWKTLFVILAIILGAFALRWLLGIILRRSVQRVISNVKKAHSVDETQELASAPQTAARIVQRSRTLGTVINSMLSVVVFGAAFIVILDVLNVPILGILGAAGVLAAGLAFGAQSLVKDILNGMFMVFEDQFGVGDVIDVGVASGTVESVGIRATSIRSVDGTLWHIPNGEILRVGNMSQGWARVIIDLPLPYHEQIDRLKQTILDAAKELAADRDWRRKILETPEIWGVESLTAEAVVLRLVVKTRTADQWAVARELRIRIKSALDAIGVNVPSLRRTILEDRRITQIPTAENKPTAKNSPGTKPIPTQKTAPDKKNP